MQEFPRVLDTRVYRELFESLPEAVVVVGPGGEVAAHNPAARDLFGALVDRPDLRCCDLVGCGRGSVSRPLAHHCIPAAVADRGRRLEGLDFEHEGRRIEVAAAPLPAGAGAVLQFRAIPGAAAAPAAGAPLIVTTLGPLGLRCGGMSLGGEWLDHRPGQLLKYLICARGHRVPVDELVETLWPDSGRAGLTSLRQAVHGLRERLQPGRPKNAPSGFVLARPNSYELDTANIVIDADDFEREAVAALVTVERSGGEQARAQLARAADLYQGEFLADEPYAEWALAERDRLLALAVRVLREHAELYLAADELPAASSALQRLVDLEPLDLDAHRELISLLLRQRRHADAARHFNLARRQFKRAFGHEPDFALADLVEPHAALVA